MKRLILLLVLMLMLAAVAGCGPAPTPEEVPEESGQETATDQEVAQVAAPELDVTPSPDRAAMSGRVLTTAQGGTQPLGGTEIWLAIIYWNDDKSEGAMLIDGAANPSTVTNAEGAFVFPDLEPRDYAIVVGELYGQNVVLQEADGGARIYSPVAGEVLEVGTIEVDLAPGPPPTNTPNPAYPAPETAPNPYP